MANQIKRTEKRIKALQKQLENIKKAGVSQNVGLSKWATEKKTKKNFQSMTVAELKAELKAKGLSRSGKKTTLLSDSRRGIKAGAHRSSIVRR